MPAEIAGQFVQVRCSQRHGQTLNGPLRDVIETSVCLLPALIWWKDHYLIRYPSNLLVGYGWRDLELDWTRAGDL